MSAVKYIQLAAVTIPTAGTPVEIFDKALPCTSILIQADALNTGSVYVGDENVDDTAPEIKPGGELLLTGELQRGSTEEFIIKDIFVDTDTGGNLVRISVIRRRL